MTARGQTRRVLFTGSLTVEASLVFPLFFYAVMSICCFFGYMEVKRAVKSEMIEMARDISAFGDLVGLVSSANESVSEVEETSGLVLPFVDAITLGTVFRERTVTDNRIVNYVKGGAGGISFLGSELITDKDTIKIVCEYNLKAPTSLFNTAGIPVHQEVEYRYFTGYKVKSLLLKSSEDDEDGSDKVYITENGTVYHLSVQCPSLKIKAFEVGADEVPGRRNSSGGRYYACEKCARGSMPESLYITPEGDRYHFRLDCSGLKRTVKEVSLDDLDDDFAECRRCGQKEESDGE